MLYVLSKLSELLLIYAFNNIHRFLIDQGTMNEI